MIRRITAHLESMGIAETRARELAVAISILWKAVCPLDLRHLRMLEETAEGRALLTLSEMAGSADGSGTRREFRVRDGRLVSRDEAEEIDSLSIA